MRIAVLDSNPGQAELVCQVLAAAGHACQHFQGRKALLEHIRDNGFDILIVDSQTGDASGVDILHVMRGRLPPALPVLFLAGRSEEDDIVTALQAGANDYMIKPLRRGELLTRVSALLKRAYPQQEAPQRIEFGPYTFELSSCRVTRAGTPIEITQKEFELALLFFRNLGRPLSRAYILETIWSRDAEVPSRTMDTHVSRVRRKLGLRPENGFRLAPVYSYGYRLEQLPQTRAS